MTLRDVPEYCQAPGEQELATPCMHYEREDADYLAELCGKVSWPLMVIKLTQSAPPLIVMSLDLFSCFMGTRSATIMQADDTMADVYDNLAAHPWRPALAGSADAGWLIAMTPQLYRVFMQEYFKALFE